MRKNFYYLFLCGGLFFSCGDSDDSIANLKAKGGVKYGGTFHFMSSEKVSKFLPLATIDIYTQRINDQIFESLLTFDNNSLKVLPNIAESYKVSPDGLTYTFKIRDKVYFHKDDCFSSDERMLTAEDVKFSLDLACSGLPISEISYLLKDKVRGAKEFHEATKTKFNKAGVSGIVVKDNHTVEIKLVQAQANFDKIMAHSNLAIIAPEAYEKYGEDLPQHPVGTGAFTLASVDDKKIVLNRNPRYWKKDDFGNTLPYLESIEMTYSETKKSELLAFRKGEIDIVLEIPVDEMDHILGTLEDAQSGKNLKHKMESETSLNVNYVGFACNSKEFSDPKVRLAFHHAINKIEIVDNYLQGEGNAAMHGYIPPMGNFPIKKVNGIKYNVEKAKSLLAAAGYANGAGLGVIDFYVNGKEGSAFSKMAQGIKEQLKANLNVDINIKLCSYEEREAAIASGKAKMWRSGWIADYPDAENFMVNFYSTNANNGKSSLNPFQYKNPTFDNYFNLAVKQSDPEKSIANWVKCDQIIADDSPVIPILTDDFLVLINAKIKNFESNSMEMLDFSRIFIKEPKTN